MVVVYTFQSVCKYDRKLQKPTSSLLVVAQYMATRSPMCIIILVVGGITVRTVQEPLGLMGRLRVLVIGLVGSVVVGK